MTTTTVLVARRTMLGAFALFLLVASIGPKLAGASVAADTLVHLGWSANSVTWLGLLELACLLLILVPRTRILGALLMTAFLGGTVATHARAASPLFSHTFFGLYLGVFMWSAILLEEPALRRLLPFRPGRT
jgi:hypothetical protein